MRFALFLAALLIAAAPALGRPPPEGRRHLLDPGRLRARSRRRSGRRRDPGRPRHRRPHLPAQADRCAHPGRGARCWSATAWASRAGSIAWPRRPASRAGASWPRRARRRIAIRIAGRTSPARGATSPTSPTGWPPPIRRTPRAIAHARGAVRPAAGDARRLDPPRDRDRARRSGGRRSPATPRSAISRAPTTCASSAPRGYTTDSEPTARDVANLIRQVREQKIKALFIENMTNPALVAEIARNLRRSRRPAPLQRRAVQARRPRPDLRGDDAPQRDGAGRGDEEELDSEFGNSLRTEGIAQRCVEGLC